MKKKIFEHFVSLGHSCPVAASMGKYGLRGWSGVFDWLNTGSSFAMLLHYMENDFADFLIKDNLEEFLDNPMCFVDKANGFHFVHDGYLFEKEYDKLKEKYNYKIRKFIIETSKPTCFLRYIRDEEEIDYIKEKADYIRSVITKNNAENEIWFLVSEDKKMDGFPFECYKIKATYSGETREKLRGLFDQNIEFLQKCASSINSENLVKNLHFDYEKEDRYNQYIKRYQLALQMHWTDWTSLVLPKVLRIFGGGNIGRVFLKNVRNRCEVESFVDNDIGKQGTYIDGIIVKALAKTDFSKKIPIVVTATYDFERTCEDIKKYDKDAIVLSLDEVLENRAVF